MALLAWNDSFSVKVKTLDGQHKNLFETVNELHTAMTQGKAQAVTGAILKRLVRYTLDHFSWEEQAMEAAKYPGLAAHRTVHVDLTRQVQDFMARYERGEGAVNIELLSFLSDWLTKHILQQDREYGPWLNRHGVR